MKTLIAFLLIATATIASAQQPPQKNTPKENRNDNLETGPIAGGGGFTDTNGSPILEKAQETLMYQLNSASWKIFGGARTTHAEAEQIREKLVDLIASLRHSPHKPRKFRINPKNNQPVLLEFNYGTDEKGDYIEALEPFFIASSMTVMPTPRTSGEEQILRLVQRKMLHEAAHHLGYPEEEKAAYFAYRILRRLENHFVLCDFTPDKVQFAKTNPNDPLPHTYISFNTVKGVLNYESRINRIGKPFEDVVIEDLNSVKTNMFCSKKYDDKNCLATSGDEHWEFQLTLIEEISEGEFQASYVQNKVMSKMPEDLFVMFGRCRSLVGGAM